ncbi:MULTISPECIES: transcriptional regulator [unclassified Pseudoalteromonas]|uniref:CAF17-like 4Fe-4S cluster assembly/insertion protein YgfZ n=1 Tax=unclassified Pseudoalteromonas TaxID=194690 RepID=UPI0020976A16|nr:transcriptional regulator [Pseudoalteromonas sp. XMcav2-N]MCO7187044.1 transcriptional regulator [Pseudoalteromonas sp. XMcav2-N]
MAQANAYPLSLQLISVSGSEKLSYLHGQVTQDLNLLTDDTFLWAGHCSPKGKLWATLRLSKLDDQYLLLGSKAETEASCRELKKYGVFAKVDIDITHHQVIGVLTDEMTETCELLGLTFAQQANACTFDGKNKALKLDNQRLILIVEHGYALPQGIALHTDPTPFEAASILAGEPQLSESSIDEYVPQMVNLQALGAISFKKGCYTGQETVARMRYLGKNKRALYIVKGQAAAHPQESELEIQLDGDNWRRAGKVLHQAYDSASQDYYALAVMANDLTESSVLRAKTHPEVQLTLQPLPYSLEDN